MSVYLKDEIALFKNEKNSFNIREQAYQKAVSLTTQLRTEISNLQLQEKQFNGESNTSTRVAEMANQINTYRETIKKFKGINGYDDISATVKAMQDEVVAFQSSNASAEQKAIAYKILNEYAKTYRVQLNNLNVQMRNLDATKVTNLQTQLQGIWNKHGAEIGLNTEVLTKFQAVQKKLEKGLGSEGSYTTAKEASQAVAELKKELTKAGVYTDSLSVKMQKLFGVHLKTQLTMLGIHALSQGFRQLIQTIKEIDAALTQLEIVTGTSGASLEHFAYKAFKAAEKIGASATDIMKSTETWARLGYSLDDSLSLATTTAQFSNVGNISVDDATTSMTSVLKAYYPEMDNVGANAQKVADILTNVGQKYAISASELGEALQAGGASLEAANNSLEESVALMAAGNASVQNASIVGNATKTVGMRIRGASAELEESGEEVDEFCKSTSKMQATIKGLSGVDILKDDGETFRSTYDILLDIAKVWEDLSDINRASLLEALAGKRQATVVKSIITNINDLTGAYEAAQNASGTVAKSNEVYLDSIEGRLSQFSAKFQEFSNAVGNSDLFKDIISGGTTLVTVLQGILTVGDGIILKIGALIAGIKLIQALKLGNIMPSIPERYSNGRVTNIKLVKSWEVCEYYNYKAA